MLEYRATIAAFFDKCAFTWDAAEITSPEKIERLVAYAEVKKGERVLDIACGTGIISGILQRESGNVTAIDISRNMIDLARAKHPQGGIRFEQCDIYEFLETDFDCAVVYNAYPHFIDRVAFVNKLRALLGIGGRVVIIHSMGRKMLNEHHKSVHAISSTLLSAQEEAGYFLPHFDIIKTVDLSGEYVISAVRRD